MKIKYYVVDAFTDKAFKGNPAGICTLDAPISDELMQQIAFENNLSETAFVYKENDIYRLRWFTPIFEINLCGHATLATAYIIFRYVDTEAAKVTFNTMSGLITVEKQDDLYMMSLPIWNVWPVEVNKDMIDLLGFTPSAAYGQRDLFVLMNSEDEVREYVPNYDKLAKLDRWMGVVVTARGEKCDFVSRYFCPELSLEDPVTGSSHSSLVPLWSEILGKKEMETVQLSKRSGNLHCKLTDSSVEISGSAIIYLDGYIEV